MNTLSKVIVLLSLSSAFSDLYAHGDNKHDASSETMEFDAVTTEFGSYDPVLKADRTIEVGMYDNMRFTPDVIEVSDGETIRFVVTNHGKILHEFVLGTAESLQEHAALMMKFPGMEHEEPYMAHVSPGKTMEIVWQFSKGGQIEFGCLIPGHFDAGMKGTVAVN